jgi:Protein of unknown function DUF262
MAVDEVNAQHLTAARYKIEELLRLVQQGKVRIPRFQRPLRWTGTDVERLFDSVYRGFPIGTLLFWVRPAEAAIVHLGPVVLTAPELSDAYWVVDGQQRITSLAAALLPADGTEPDSRFEISFDLERENFGRTRLGDADTRIPVRAAYDLQRVLAWLRERDLDTRLQERAFKLADRLRNYELPAYQVATTDERAMQDVFDRTNTFGKSMTKAEVFRALNTSSTEPRADIATLDSQISALGFGPLAGNTLLYAVLASRGPDVLREFRTEFTSPDDQMAALDNTRRAVERVAAFLTERADVPHFSLVPYQHQMVGLVRFFSVHPEPEAQILVLLRRWFWQAAEVGPVPRLGATGTLRSTAAAIVPDDPYKSVRSLLELSVPVGSQLEIGAYRWTNAGTRVSVCALAQLQPVDLNSGELIDVTRSVELLGRDALIPIVDPRRGGDLSRTVANRLFASYSDGPSDSEIVAQLGNAEPPQLDSHCLDQASAALLVRGDEAGFLTARHEGITRLVDQFVAARAERHVRTRPPLADFAGLDN